MPRKRKGMDLEINPDLIVAHRPKTTRPHIATEYREMGKDTGPSDPVGKVAHSRSWENRELVRHLKRPLQDRVLTMPKKKENRGRNHALKAAA